MHLDLMRDKSKVFPALAQSNELRSLRIWHCRYRTLNQVSALRNLETLIIATFPDSSLAALSPLGRLRYLRVLHLPLIRDLSPLATLSQLECLSLETLPSWDSSSRVTEV